MDKKLQDALDTITAKVAEYQRRIEDLPRTSDQVEAMLEELAKAEQDVRDHFVRYPRPEGSSEPYMGRKDVEEDWTRVLRRRDAAVAALVRLAQAKYPARAAEIAA